ncbi:MAG: polysulfide reductase NrfD [Cyclobacteriaceae bacterium]|nr:polysulfide reductase NrfD [Cyclobacteriaceae bacterium]MCK5280660.1 polysulfide reductase NrfD [Cyclobacteriaceae bacterium]MCK5371027.1 polysulfide reductase NrfD [Cyclobacteriaceae bacterium]MCK5705358.1 polysulfide reductase NrfD [Cyclobacteriaceae bacterium]
MNEITITRHNEMIDPLLHAWGWEIPIYLFLGGMVAGMMIIAGYFLFIGRFKEVESQRSYLPFISFILLSLGMVALFLDLEHKLYVWRLYLTFEVTSPMSWGSWILILIYPILLAGMIVSMPEKYIKKIPFLEKIRAFLKANKTRLRSLAMLNILFGVMLGMYTGVLLSSLGARPLWSTSILWVLFLTSGLSGAAAFVHMIAKDKYERELLAKGDNIFLSFELVVIIMMLVSLVSTSEVHMNAAMLLINGKFAMVFWVFVVGLGIVIPLIVQLLAVNHKIKHQPLAPIMVIVGGLVLRFVIVGAGQYSHWF